MVCRLGGRQPFWEPAARMPILFQGRRQGVLCCQWGAAARPDAARSTASGHHSGCPGQACQGESGACNSFAKSQDQLVMLFLTACNVPSLNRGRTKLLWVDWLAWCGTGHGCVHAWSVHAAHLVSDRHEAASNRLSGGILFSTGIVPLEQTFPGCNSCCL